MQAVKIKLKKQKNVVQAYVMDEIFDKMEGGEAALAPYYAGDALVMIEDNPDLAFCIPAEGTNFFIDEKNIWRPGQTVYRRTAGDIIDKLRTGTIKKAIGSPGFLVDLGYSQVSEDAVRKSLFMRTYSDTLKRVQEERKVAPAVLAALEGTRQERLNG